MTLKGFFIPILLVSFTLSLLTAQARREKSTSTEFPQIIDHVEHSIGAVVRSDNPLGFGVPIGSGFFIDNEGYFVTNAHVARAFEKLRSEGVGVGLTVPLFDSRVSRIVGNGVAVITAVEIDGEDDVALFHADSFRGTSKKPLSVQLTFDTTIPLATGIAVTGFPFHHPYPITITASITSNKEVGNFVDDLAGVQLPGPYYFIDKPIARGFSGSPVYLQQTGQVIGIAARTLSLPVETKGGPSDEYMAPAMGEVLTLDHLRSILTKHKVSYTAS